MRGRRTVLSLVAMAAMLLVSAVAFANDGQVPGTKESDDLTMFDGNDRVFARGGDDEVDGGAGDDRIRGGHGDDTLFGGDGDDRLKGGQDNDYLDGGEGDDYINGRGDGRDKDKIVCGDGYDVVQLGKGDVVLVEAGASEDAEGEGVESVDGCEKVRSPKGKEPKKRQETCAANSGACEDEPLRDPCVARFVPSCDDPEVLKPAPDEPVEELEPDGPGEV